MLQINLLTNIIYITIIAKLSNANSLKQCPDYQIHFEKILGYRPTVTPLIYGRLPAEEKILYKSYHQLPSTVNLQCMEICRSDQYCESYVLNLNKSECYGYTSNDQRLDSHNFRSLDNNELVEDISVVYFVKTCLNSEYL